MVNGLWNYVVTALHWGGDFNKLVGPVPKVFQSRIKKMLNLDRIPGMTPWTELDDSWIFYDEPGQGVGSEDLFSTFHVFMMSMAIELMNIGLKQSEIIFVLKHGRDTFQEQFDRIHEREDKRAPVTGFARSPASINASTWMILRREEMQEIHPGFKKKAEGKKIPLFLEPDFFDGFEAVRDRFAGQLASHRHSILIEIADPALSLPGYLADAPFTRRGRAPSS